MIAASAQRPAAGLVVSVRLVALSARSANGVGRVLCANNRETGAPRQINEETEQGENDMNNAKRGLIVDRKVEYRSDREGETTAFYRRVQATNPARS